MKKIKITENQAKRLGLIKESNEDIGLKTANLGPIYIKITIEGPSVAKNKDFILARGKKFDETNTLAFFEATGKIVGNIDSKRIKTFVGEMIKFDPTITVTNKLTGRKITESKKIKITKEQYNRIFATKLYESTNTVDKTFKKEFSGVDIKNLGESNFDIQQPNTSFTKSIQGTFGKDMIQEDLKNETLELIKYFYRKSDKLSPFWGENGVSYDDICDVLTTKGLIIKKDGSYQVSKKAGSKEEVMNAIENTLNELIGEVGDKKLETEGGGYPAGAEYDSTAPYNQPEPKMVTSVEPKEKKIDVLALNREIAILKAENQLLVFPYEYTDRSEFMPYAAVQRRYVGKDEDGQPEYEYDENFEIDAETISNYVNDNISKLEVGEGISGWENGDTLIKIDEELKQELISLFGLNKNIVSALSSIAESIVNDDKPKEPSGMDMVKKNLDNHLQKPKTSTSKEEIRAKLKTIRDKELKRRKNDLLEDNPNIGDDNFSEDALAIKMFNDLSKEYYSPMGKRNENFIDRIVLQRLMKDGYVEYDNDVDHDENGRAISSNDFYWFTDAGIQNITSPEQLKDEYFWDSYEKNPEKGMFGEDIVDETTTAASSGAFVGPMNTEPIKRNINVVTESINRKYTHFAILKSNNKIVDGWDYKGVDIDDIKYYSKLDLKDNFPERKLSDFSIVGKNNLIKKGIDPFNLANWNQPVNEVTSGSGAMGAYDANALPGINRDGSFKSKKKTKVQTTPQWSGGAFVEQPDCSKMNNNKEAQNGGCNSGASSLKLHSKGGSINAPSLGESFIREALKIQHDKENNKLIVLSDLTGKEGSAETFKNKNLLKSKGFTWNGNNWVIGADKFDVAKETLSIANKVNFMIEKLEELEDFIDDSNADNKNFLKSQLNQYVMDLANATDEAALSAEIRRYLTFFSKFHKYSFYNRILIYIQNPNATQVASYKFWQTKHRQVQKDAKAIKVLAPIINKGSNDETPQDNDLNTTNAVRGFKAVSVFDISDTKATSPEGETPNEPDWFGENTPSETADKLFVAVTDLADDMNIKVTSDDAKGGERGYSAGDHINITSGVEGVGRISTMIHEMAHELMHRSDKSLYYIDNSSDFNKSRQLKELQAESVSYVVLKHYGLPVSHHATYLALWKANKETIQSNLEVISKVSEFLIKKIDEKVKEISPNTITQPQLN
jgi:hypothetical protein